MELIQIDALQPQALQAAVNRAPQMFGATVRNPRSAAWSQQATLRRNDQTRRVRMQGLRYHRLVRLRAITIRCIDKIHAKLDGAMQNPIGLPSIPWSSPSAIAAQAHRAEAQSIDCQVTEANCPRKRCACASRLSHPRPHLSKRMRCALTEKGRASALFGIVSSAVKLLRSPLGSSSERQAWWVSIRRHLRPQGLHLH